MAQRLAAREDANIGKRYLNDNIRAPHLKCENCKIQIFLLAIEPAEDGGEVRTFGCPHCRQTAALRLTSSRHARETAPRAVARGAPPQVPYSRSTRRKQAQTSDTTAAITSQDGLRQNTSP